MYIDLAELSPARVYFTLTQTVIPRPVAWVLSDNGDGSHNLAPFSYFTPVCSDPPLILLSLGKKPNGAPKDTRVNIERRRNFVVHIVHRELVEPMVETSRTLPHGESELSRVRLPLTEFAGFPLPRLSDCRVAFACELHALQEVGQAPQALIFGRVRSAYVADAVVHEDPKGRLVVRADAVDPVGRLGGSGYGTLGDVLTIPRPP